MVTISIESNFKEVKKKMSALHDDIRGKALAAAINRTADKGRTEATRQISSVYAIKQTDVRPNVLVRKASAKGGYQLVAIIEAFPRRRGHRSRNVALFSPKQKSGRKTKSIRFKIGQKWITKDVRIGGGVTVKIKRGGPRKMIEGAFIGNKGRTVFIRENGASRLPIKAVETIDIPQMFNSRRINNAIIRKIEQEFPVEAERAMRYFIERFNA